VIIKCDTPTFRVCASQVLARRKASWISWWTLQLQGSSYGGGSCNSFHSPVFMSKLLSSPFFVSWVSNQFMQSANFFFLKICGARALGLNCKKTAVIDSSLLVMHLDRLLEKVSPVLSWCTSSCVKDDFFGILQHDIFVLNCDVCCSFPLTEMLGKLFNISPFVCTN
jgi:hypothetical protein